MTTPQAQVEHPTGPSHRLSRRSALLLLVACLSVPAAPVTAQLVQVKTVPVASGDQFLLLPSGNLAMGGVGLALPDTLGDPFGNPATGGRLAESIFFGSPTYYGISDRNGSGRSLPLGALFVSGDWFGGGALSLQELKGAERDQMVWPLFLDIPAWSSRAWPMPGPTPALSEASARNVYAFGMVGFRLPRSGLSLGVSGSYADLGAMDGVDLLYAQSLEIHQSGHISDLRFGLLKEWEGDRSLEVLLLRNRVRMQHDVTYLNLIWEPVPPDTFPIPQWQARTEENLDYTDTWGAQLAYRRPLNQRGWKLGWSLTANRKDHPKIPNYEIQNIPRDPGNTQAYSLGLGIAKTQGPARFGADLYLEPIRSETWADAAGDTTSAQGGVIKAGERTIENDFLFTNVHIKTGAAFDYRKATFQAGLQVRSISYELDQFDRIQLEKRTQDESWMEWTPSLGVSLNLPGIRIQWVSRVTTGTGRPGTRWTNNRIDEASGAVPLSSDFILAPSGPLTLQDARVTTHQLSLVIPMR